MNVDDKVEAGRILAQTEVLGAVGLPHYTLYAEGMASREGSNNQVRIGEDSFHVAIGVDVKRCHV